jgi:hypothetical protein
MIYIIYCPFRMEFRFCDRRRRRSVENIESI